MVESTAKLRDEILAVAGVDILDATGRNFKSTYQIMSELAKVWGQLDGLAKQGLLDKIAGKRGSVAVGAALQNWNIAEQARDLALNGGGSMDEQLAVYESSIQASLDKFHVAFQELSTDLINSDFIKGIVDTGTTIIKIIDELVNHIGVLGTALTGLGIGNVIKTAVVGAKSIEGTGKALSAAFDIITTGSSTAADKVGALQSAITALGKSGGGAKSALAGLFSSLGTFLSNPITLGVGAAALAGVAIYGAIKKQNADLQKQASATTDSWNETKNSVDEYKQKYEALNKQLEQGNLSESERIGIKQQLLDLQNEIVGKYGEQVNGIDLVNGKLETQLGILSNISRETASRNLQDNDRAYQQSVNEMEKRRTYTLSNGNQRGGMAVRTASAEMQKRIDSLYQGANFDKNGEVFRFTGDASEFDEAVRDVLNGLNKLKESASESDKVILQGAIDSAQKALEKNNDVLQKYQDNYNAYLEQNLYSQGYGDELAEYAKRTQAYNDALLSGNTDTIKEAKLQLDEYQGTVDGILGDHPEYGDFFDEIANSVDKTTEAIINFKDIIDDGVAESTNGLKGYESDIKRTVNNIKALGLDGVDVRNILLNGGVGFGDLSELAKIFNPDFDFSNENEIDSLIDLLSQLGIIADGAGDGIDLASSAFTDFLKVASASIETVEKANAALINSFGNKGLSMGIDAETGEITGDVATIINAYKDLKGYDAGVLFERTADGINVNTGALRALQSEQEAMVKADFARKIAEAQIEIGKAGTVEGKKYWEDQLQTVQLLSTAYDGATSSYQKWIDAQKMTSPGSKYDTIVNTALKQAKEYYDKGLVGNPVFQAVAQLFTNEDLSLASPEEITKAYEDGIGTVKKYFTEGQEGAKAFADKLVELNLAKKEGEEYDFGESGINTKEVAEELGISVDLVEAAFGKLQEYGFTINFVTEDQLSELGSLRDKADEAKQKLAELADEEGKVGDTDVSTVIDIDLDGIDTIDECNKAIDQINEAKASADVDSEEYEYLDGLLKDIVLMRDVLEQGSKPSVDDSELVSAQETYDTLVNRMTLLAHMNAAPGVHFDIDNDDQVRELAETLLNMDDEEYKAKIGIDGIDTVDGIIDKLKQEHIDIPVTADTSGVQTSVNTSGTVDYSTGSVEAVGAQTAVLNYKTGSIEPLPVQTANLDYLTHKIEKIPDQEAKINYKRGTLPSIPDPSATINYTANVTGLSALPDNGEHRKIYLDTYTVQHYKGTVSKSAFQSMSSFGSVTSGSSHANGTLGKVGLKRDENALINELGAEIVVRPSDDSWMIFNNGMPTFAPLKKDDVIFNADLTRQLLKKGRADDYARILSGGSHAIGTVKGSAHVTKVKGGGSFKTAVNTSTTKSKDTSSSSDKSKKKSNKEAKDFKETLDEIEILIDRIERRISNLDTISSNTFNNLSSRNSALGKSMTLVSREIDNQSAAYKRYIKQANKVGLDSKLAEKVRNGRINIEDIKDEKVWKKVEDYKKWMDAALSCRDAVYKLRVDEADLWNQRFELYQTHYENQIEQYQHMYDMMDSYIEMAENTGRITANKYRSRQIAEENKKVDKLTAEYDKLKKVMTDALASGKIKINSEGYYEMLGTLNEINENIVSTKANIEELNKSIRETNWEIFDKGAEAISNMSDELEFLYGLLGDEENMFDDKGIVNDEGIAGFGILSAQYNVAMKEAQKYASEIEKINKEIKEKDDPYNQDLIDRRQELYESQRKAIEGANDYKDSIVDLVETGIKKQIDSLKELISNYEDLMDAQKDEIDYAKKISDAQNNVNKIQKQLNAYANDDTEEGASRRQRLRNDLKNAQENLAQTEEERRMSQTKKLLSDLQGEYENILNSRLDNVDALIQAVIDGVDANASVIKAAVETAATDVGYSLTSEVGTIFNDATKDSVDLASYFTNGDFLNKVTSISTAVANIEQYYKDAVSDANKTATTNINDTTNAQNSTISAMEKAANKGTKARNSANKMTGFDGSWITDKKGNRVGWKFNDGTKATGWSKIDGKQYYFDNNGKLKAGLQTIGGSKYYIRSKSGKAVNQWQQVNKKWYYFDKNGKAVSGWKNLTKDGKKGWFYFNPKTNQMAVNSWIRNSSKKGTYYVGSNGMMFANGKFKTKDGYRTFDKNGKWKGYKSGTKSVSASGLYWTNEGAPETIIRKSDGAVLTKLNSGDTVLNNVATQNMWDFANNPQKFLRGLGVNNTYGSGNNVNLEFNLSGLRSPSEFMDALRKDKRFEKLIQEMTLGRVNGHGVLAKNAIRI